MEVTRFTSLVILIAISMAGCNFRASEPEAELPDVQPIPIHDEAVLEAEVAESTPVEATDEFNRAPVAPPISSALSDDPAPAPPLESLADTNEINNNEERSAKDAFDSVARVVQGAIVGSDDVTGEPSKGSVFGSVGRAMINGFQEAVMSDEVADIEE